MEPSCPACPSGDITTVSLDYTFFGGRDLRPLRAPPNPLSRCARCGLVFGGLDPKRVSAIEAIFTSPGYLKTRVAKLQVIGNGPGHLATRQFLQADLLMAVLPDRRPAILEIGCFDGSLLREFETRFEGAKLHGFDVNRGLEDLFPKGPNFQFFLGDLDACDGPYDLIVLSHSIQYIRDIPSLMTKLKGLLKPGGIVFVQVPDYSENPYSLLLGDKFYHYTEASLAAVFAEAGFTFEPMERGRFPRDVLGLARLGETGGQKNIRPGNEFKDALERLKCAREKLTELPPNRSFGVLGTHIGAVFVDSVLGSKIVFFADENPENQGMVFHGKAVVRPRSLVDDDTLIIPFGKTAHPICRRFEKDYRGKFIAL